MVVLEVNAQAKAQTIDVWTCYICEVIGHYKLTNCLKFNEMQNIFKNKGGKTIEEKLVIDVKIITTLVNMVDVHVGTTKSKETKV